MTTTQTDICAYCGLLSSSIPSNILSTSTFITHLNHPNLTSLPSRRPRVRNFTNSPSNPIQINSTTTRTTPHSSLSSYFPVSDIFALPGIAFLHTTASSDLRPELLGSLLWSAGLYLGFSQKTRWGSLVYKYLLNSLSKAGLSLTISDLIAALLHSAPFLMTGFAIDAASRYFNDGNAVWAVASGLSIAMYGGVYELGRLNVKNKQVPDSSKRQFEIFIDFSNRKLQSRGMCHFVDVRTAIRDDSKARMLANLSDETLRRFVRNSFPKAKRSPNGYYRGLSIKKEQKITTPSASSNSTSSS